MSAVASGWGSGLGAGGAVLAIAVQPGLLVPVLLASAALGGLPLLLITTLALVVVFTRVPARQAAAERVLDRLLSTLRPCDPYPPRPGGATRPPRARDRPTRPRGSLPRDPATGVVTDCHRRGVIRALTAPSRPR